MNNSNPRGAGFCKTKCLAFCRSNYVVLIRKTINEVENEYQNNNEADALLLGGTMKLETRSSSLSYARQKKNKTSLKEKYLKEKKYSPSERLDAVNVTVMKKRQITEEISIIHKFTER